jgi:hypothetical protein
VENRNSWMDAFKERWTTCNHLAQYRTPIWLCEWKDIFYEMLWIYLYLIYSKCKTNNVVYEVQQLTRYSWNTVFLHELLIFWYFNKNDHLELSEAGSNIIQTSKLSILHVYDSARLYNGAGVLFSCWCGKEVHCEAST